VTWYISEVQIVTTAACCHEQVMKIIYAAFDVPILVLLKIQIFWDVLSHWIGVPSVLKDHNALTFRDMQIDPEDGGSIVRLKRQELLIQRHSIASH